MPSLLHGEQVGEVGVEEQLHRTEGGLVAEVADDEVLAHPLAHIAASGTPSSVESARPGRGGHRDTKTAEKGSSATAASGSGLLPFTRSSKRERIRVSRTNRPWGPPGDDVARGTADGEGGLVDQSDHTAGLAQARGLAGEGPRITHRGDATGPARPTEHLVGASLEHRLGGGRAGPRRGLPLRP